MYDFETPDDAKAVERDRNAVEGRTIVDERTSALFGRYGCDAEFRAAVDDMTEATGLALPGSALGPGLDEVLHLARYMREHVPSTPPCG
jgi:hypothetical protein